VVAFLQKVWTQLNGLRKGSPDEAELSVVFLNNDQMQNYNRQYRKKDYPTDVLSFPAHLEVENGFYLGDLLISAPKTAIQAEEKGHSFQQELQILLLHGVLHLLGYDHETDTGEMDRLERRLRRKLLLFPERLKAQRT
jgi:probable rRNA maturation factor